jgi:8-oxo-dGTP pyrophosphatase MutT (NUDIX family)
MFSPSETDHFDNANSEIGMRSPIPPRKRLDCDGKDEVEYYKTPSFPSLPSIAIRIRSPKRSQSSIGKHSQSEPMLSRRLPKLTLSTNIIPSSSTQQKRKLKRKMERDNWRSNNNENRQLRTTYYPDSSFRLLNQMDRYPVNFYTDNRHRGSWKNSPSDHELKSQCNDYAPGKRCGIIPVDTRISLEGKKIVSLMVVMGRPTMMENGRAMNIWSFGKGRMMETETEEKCAIREFWEETGIKISTVANLPRIELGKNVYFILHTTKEAMPTEQLAIKDVMEVQDVAWKTVDDLREIEKRISPDQRVNKDVRAIIRYPIRSFYYHKLIFNPETRHPVQDIRELTDQKLRVGNFIVPTSTEQDKIPAAN